MGVRASQGRGNRGGCRHAASFWLQECKPSETGESRGGPAPRGAARCVGYFHQCIFLGSGTPGLRARRCWAFSCRFLCRPLTFWGASRNVSGLSPSPRRPLLASPRAGDPTPLPQLGVLSPVDARRPPLPGVPAYVHRRVGVVHRGRALCGGARVSGCVGTLPLSDPAAVPRGAALSGPVAAAHAAVSECVCVCVPQVLEEELDIAHSFAPPSSALVSLFLAVGVARGPEV